MKTVTASFLVSLLLSSAALAESASITVKGMVCESCAEAVTGKLQENPAVESVSVQVNKGLVEVVLKPGATVADDTLKTLIADAGYTATEIHRKS